jgi:Cu/Ag efflux protein CusF
MDSRSSMMIRACMLLVVAAGCRGGAPKEPDHPRPAADARAAASPTLLASPSAAKAYDIKGRISALDTPGRQVTINHEEIKGLMGAMEMTYPVADARLLEGLKAGDEVEGKLEVRGEYVITQLKKR